MRAFWLAWQLLTRLPAPRGPAPDAETSGRSVLFYPLVGLIIGLLLAALCLALRTSAPMLQAALMLLAWVLLTGGLHLDGLADSADAWAGSHGDRAEALRIMKDAASGPAGVTAVVLILLIKFAALSVILEKSFWPALLIAPVLGRAGIVWLFLTLPYVRPGGLGAAHATYLPRRAAIAVLIVTAGALPLAGRTALWAMLAAALVMLTLRAMMQRRLGGATGDTLGAGCEVAEVAALVAMALAG